MDLFIRLISDLLISTFTLICWNKCLEIDSSSNKKKNIILILIIIICVFASSVFLLKPIKLFANFIGLILINYLFVSKNLRKSFILVIVTELIVLLVEFVFAFICSIIISDNFRSINNQQIIMFILNILIMITGLVLLKLQVPQKIFKFADKITSLVKKSEAFIYSLMIIIVIIISLTESYMRLPLQLILITNIIMGIIFISITLKITIVKSNLNKIDKKYQTSLSSLKEYEIMIDKFRINSHENKNELLTIRNMIKDKKTVKYIDKLINNKIKDNEMIMKETAKIPEGGLRATIYSKMCTMDKYNINYKLYIAKDVRTVDIIKLNDDTILNICKILGVFLDNSIESVKKLKEKNILIEIYTMDNNLCIEISNNYEGNIDIDKISKSKYTTKGNGHGYGLSLVSKIIEENKKILENEKRIKGQIFTQILKIKM